MRTNHIHTFCLVPENDREYQQWEALLTPCCWAQGEFGAILTESAFRRMERETIDDATVPRAIRCQLAALAAAVEAGDYADVCLQPPAASAGHAG